VAKLVLIGILAILSQHVAASDDFACSQSQNEAIFNKFTFEVTERARAPGENVAFRFCRGREHAFLLVRVEKRGEPKRIPLSDEQSAKILGLYDRALDSNFKDDVIGLDGASWCLETKRGSNSLRACLWSPTNDAEKRGIVGFLALGNALWGIAGLDKSLLD
jgi:hypothetical protein